MGSDLICVLFVLKKVKDTVFLVVWGMEFTE